MKILPVIIGTVSLLGVLGIAAWEWKHRTSPGPLHPSHAAVAKLAGDSGCAACHGDAKAGMEAACEACHTTVREQIDSAKGLHGVIPPVTAKNCATCHRDHAGASVALVSAKSFSEAGATQDKFDHAMLGRFDLAGKHATVGCEKCHPKAHANDLKEGEKRFLGLKQDCVSCHEDSHKGVFGPDCASCHGQTDEFKAAPGFTHKEFALEQKHAGLKCEQCHEPSGPTSVAMLKVAPSKVRECAACHKDPHDGTFGLDCAACHDTAGPFDRAGAYKHTKDFALTGSHAGLKCKDCHTPETQRSVASLRRTPLPVRKCEECHPSAHTRSAMAGFDRLRHTGASVCEECHHTDSRTFLFPEATMTPAQHAATGFLLDKPHDKLECKDCHQAIGKREPLARTPEIVTAFAALFPGRRQDDCAACHKDPHDGQFGRGSSLRSCLECHAREHFKPGEFDLAKHSASKFPLDGAHKAVACSRCHEKDRAGVVRYVGLKTACADCHRDAHEGKFDKPGMAPVVNGKAGCARCHNSERFDAVTWNAEDHGRWTKYALEGKHAQAACTDCHERRTRPDTLGRTLAPAPEACAACHRDVHAGQFIIAGVNDCARCHKNTAAFKPVDFVHDRDSKYKLDADHAKLDCTACHKTYETEEGPLVRYKPLGVECADCHDGRRGAGERKP